MNNFSDKPVLDVLAGRMPERLPFWMMRQAGRYLPEYRALRAEKGGFLDMALDPVSAAEVTVQPLRRFGMDAAIIFSDILIVPYALGQHLEFVKGEGPKLDPIRAGAGVDALNYKRFKDITTPVYEAISKTREMMKNEGFDHTAMIGFAGAPWTVACYMIEGQGSKDFMMAKVFAYQNPEAFAAIMDILIEATAAYLIEQANAGAEVLKIFDSWAGVLDVDAFNRWVIQPTRRIVEIVKDTHPHVPIIGFPRGGGVSMPKYVQETGVTAVALDTSVPTKWAANALQTLVPVQGNLDPACLKAGGDALKLAVERILADLGDKPFIFNLGHGINKDTPIEHVEQLVKLLRAV